MDSYGVANWLGYLTHIEIDGLKQLAQSLPYKPVVVNIGAGGGTSGLTFLESRPDLILYTLDIQEEDSPFGCLAGERNAVFASGVNHEGRWFQICGDSGAIGRGWERGKVDMVFIDGNHSYEGCASDIIAWLPHIKPDGILALHDYKRPGEDTNWPGVGQAIEELLLNSYSQVLLADTVIAFRMK